VLIRDIFLLAFNDENSAKLCNEHIYLSYFMIHADRLDLDFIRWVFTVCPRNAFQIGIRREHVMNRLDITISYVGNH
jgi:hypothetical protein